MYIGKLLIVQCIAGAPLLCGEQLGGDGGDRAADRQLQPPHPRPGEARHQVCRIHPGNNTVCGTTDHLFKSKFGKLFHHLN